MIKKIIVEGMTCGHCVKHIEEALKELDGVKDVNVNLESKTATIELEHEIADEAIKAAIEDAGYVATHIE